MGGLLAIGTASILGIGMRLAATGGALLMVMMMWAALRRQLPTLSWTTISSTPLS